MILLLKTYQKWFLCYHLPCTFKIFINVFASQTLYVKANSKKICEEMSFPSFFRKMLIAFLLNHQGLLWNVHCVVTVALRKQLNFKSAVIRSNGSSCSLWIPIALAKIYFFRGVLTWRKNLCIQ